MQVLQVIHHTSAIQGDQHSSSVSAAAMSALVPAWIDAGRAPADLWHEVVEALPKVQPHRRLALLSPLMAAMPSVSYVINRMIVYCAVLYGSLYVYITYRRYLYYRILKSCQVMTKPIR